MSRGEFRARAIVYGIAFGALLAIAFNERSEPKLDDPGIYNCTSDVTGETIRFHSDNAKLIHDLVSGPQMEVAIDGQPRRFEVNGSWKCVSPKGQQGIIQLKPR
jgi:hypothetical protein